jgi:hypothetical protein
VKNIASPDKNEIRLRRLMPASVFTAFPSTLCSAGTRKASVFAERSMKNIATADMKSRKQKARLPESFFQRQSTKDDLRGNAESVFAG